MAVQKLYFVYIMTNRHNRVLYTGAADDLKRRAYEHRMKLVPGFTKQYNVGKLVYYQAFGDIDKAIAEEKRIKGGSRQKKIDLINSMNPSWVDLYDEL